MNQMNTSYLFQQLTLKMIDIDSEHLGIPDQQYSVVCEMSSAEFKKTCADLAMFSDSINITATKVRKGGGALFRSFPLWICLLGFG